MTRARLLEFIGRELTEARGCLLSREDMARTWRDGTDKEWDDIAAETGQPKPPPKDERDRIAECQDRIAAKYRNNIEALETLSAIVQEMPEVRG